MGCSWSHFFAQSAHEAIVEEHGGLTGGDRLTDFVPGRGLKSGGIAHLQYVDNFAAVGGGDPVSLTQGEEGVRQVMGHTIKAIEGSISISPKRAWRLRDAMHASRLRNLSGMALEVILGHAGFCFSVRRCLLSAFGRVYAFVQAHFSAPLHGGAQCDENFGRMLRFSCRWHSGIRTYGVLTPRHAVLPHTHPAADIGRLEERWTFKSTRGIGKGRRELALADVSEDVRLWRVEKFSEEIAFTIIVAPCFTVAKSLICLLRFISKKPKLF